MYEFFTAFIYHSNSRAKKNKIVIIIIIKKNLESINTALNPNYFSEKPLWINLKYTFAAGFSSDAGARGRRRQYPHQKPQPAQSNFGGNTEETPPWGSPLPRRAGSSLRPGPVTPEWAVFRGRLARRRRWLWRASGSSPLCKLSWLRQVAITPGREARLGAARCGGKERAGEERVVTCPAPARVQADWKEYYRL